MKLNNINGDFFNRSDAKISVFDSGFLLGDGVWEGIRLHNDKLIHFDQHINRLYDGADAIAMKIQLNKDELKDAVRLKADYIALGSFFKSKLKPNAKIARLNVLKWTKKNIKKPIVAIGGINVKNYKKLLLNKANFLAISGYIWNNKKLKPVEALKKLK